jgi:hypothetical protein
MARIHEIVQNNNICQKKYAAFATIASLFNHSCVDTNVVGSYSKTWIIFRASKQIKKGDELLKRWFRPGRVSEEEAISRWGK